MNKLTENIEIIGSVIGGLIAGFIGIRKGFKSKGFYIWRKQLKSSAELDDLLMDFAKCHSKVQGATLMICENGGGVPHPTSKIKTSIISEGYTNELPQYKDHWQNQLVTPYYRGFLTTCLVDGEAYIPDSTKLNESNLKDAVVSLGIKSFQLVFLSAKKRAWYYIVISSVSHNDFEDAKLKDEIRYLKEQLISIINE